MTTAQSQSVAIANLARITNELGIKFISPFGSEIDYLKNNILGFLPDYGSSHGMIICATAAPRYDIDGNVVTWGKKNGIFFTYINIDTLVKMNNADFLSMLDDWGKFPNSGGNVPDR